MNVQHNEKRMVLQSEADDLKNKYRNQSWHGQKSEKEEDKCAFQPIYTFDVRPNATGSITTTKHPCVCQHGNAFKTITHNSKWKFIIRSFFAVAAAAAAIVTVTVVVLNLNWMAKNQRKLIMPSICNVITQAHTERESITIISKQASKKMRIVSVYNGTGRQTQKSHKHNSQ